MISAIWLRTEFGYYKLKNPHPSYLNIAKKFIMKLKVKTMLLLAVQNDLANTFDEFVSLLNGESVASGSSSSISTESGDSGLKIKFTPSDVKKHLGEAYHEIYFMAEQGELPQEIVSMLGRITIKTHFI